MNRHQLNHAWCYKDIVRLISTVDTLKLQVPVDESDKEWENIDKFLHKPAGSSVKKFQYLLLKCQYENTKPKASSWIFQGAMRKFIAEFEIESEEPKDLSDDESFFKSSASEIQPAGQTFVLDDPDIMFLMQLLPDLKSMNDMQKSLFKVEVQVLMHKLKFSAMDRE